MEPSLQLREAGSGDHADVVAMNRAMATETEGVELDAERVAAGVRAVLEDRGKGRYLLALRGGEVVGQLMLTYEWSDWRNGVFWWIQSVYVRPDQRRRGVYRALYDEVVRRARADAGVCGVRLYVHHDNARAKATYRALGMTAAEYEMFEVDFVLHR